MMALRRETLWREDESWLLAGSTELRCECGEVGDHVSQSPPLCDSEVKAVRTEAMLFWQETEMRGNPHGLGSQCIFSITDLSSGTASNLTQV